MDDFAKQHGAGMDLLGPNAHKPDALVALGNALNEFLGGNHDDSPDKVIAALGLVSLWQESAFKTFNADQTTLRKRCDKLAADYANAKHQWEAVAKERDEARNEAQSFEASADVLRKDLEQARNERDAAHRRANEMDRRCNGYGDLFLAVGETPVRALPAKVLQAFMDVGQ